MGEEGEAVEAVEEGVIGVGLSKEGHRSLITAMIIKGKPNQYNHT